MPEYSGIYLVENCVAERKRGKIMNLLYKSTRNSEKTVTASEAILKGLAAVSYTHLDVYKRQETI